MELGFQLEVVAYLRASARGFSSCKRSSFPTTAYAVTKLCTNVERGLVGLALSQCT